HAGPAPHPVRPVLDPLSGVQAYNSSRMSRLRYIARCAATLLPLLLLLGWGVQTAHFVGHLAHHHSAAFHYDNADDDWDGQCTQCRHADANAPTAAAPAFLLAATP